MNKKLLATTVAMITAGALLPAPAQAAPDVISSHLRISRSTSGPALYNIRVLTEIPMTKAEADAFLLAGAKIEVRFYGEDPASDDLQLGPITFVRSATGLSTSDEGVTLDWRFQEQPRKDSWLNEDDGFFDGRGDEIYFTARWIEASGRKLQTRSNTVKGIF